MRSSGAGCNEVMDGTLGSDRGRGFGTMAGTLKAIEGDDLVL